LGLDIEKDRNFKVNGKYEIKSRTVPIGSVVVEHSNVELINTEFNGNKATYGGAIKVIKSSKVFIYKAPTSLSDSRFPSYPIFENNDATQSGGCIFAQHSTITIKDT
jgi:hypothetical protein